ncbi:MAG TPA: metallophosphoesterase [Verrucomicrobiae bacterium]|nr:metallophosphoesterase [Verrucomicrobiae bacterium]
MSPGPIDRRRFLKTAAAAGAAAALPPFAFPTGPAPGSFDFVFFTDTHIQPELGAANGCDMCFRKIASLEPEFALMGGDLVFDAFGVGLPRADLVYNLYRKTERLIPVPIHRAIGNHDAFGVLTGSGVLPTDPRYGKKMFEDLYGRTYYSFDHKGYHFFVLDSIHLTRDRLWEGRIDDDQLNWLAADLKAAGPGTPIIGVVHCPMVTAFATYAQVISAGREYNTLTVANTPDVLDLFEGCNVLAVLQGHTHINENVSYKGTQYITSGAVCGDWWHGPRLGTPEGFTVISLREGRLTSRYETYGFHALASRK